MPSRLAKLVSHRPRLVLAIWLVITLAALPFATRVNEVLDAQPQVPESSEPQQVSRILNQEFSQLDDFSVVLVSRSDEYRLGDPQFDQAYFRAIDTLQGIPGVTGVRDYRRSRGLDLVGDDGHYIISVIGIKSESDAEAKEIAAAMRTALEHVGGLEFNLAGGPASIQELEDISERDTRRAELYGLPLTLIVLVVAFGALVASGLPLLVALLSITLSFAVIYGIGQLMDFAVYTQSIVTMLGLATGIDYALLMVNRFREELRNGVEPKRAAEITSLTSGKAVVFSGATVLIALTALLVPPLAFIRSLGVGTIVVLIVSILVSTTALPSLLALLGERVNYLRITRRVPGLRSRSFWRKRAQLILRHPWAWAITGALALILLSIPALQMEVADPGARGLSPATDSRQVVSALEGVGLDGMLEPIEVLLDFGEEGFFNPSSQRQLSSLARELEDLPTVGAVYSAMSVESLPTLLLYQYYATQELALNSELRELVLATVSETGRYARLTVFPLGNLVPHEVASLRANLRQAIEEVDVRALVGGPAIFEAEWTRLLYQSFPLAIALVYLGILLVLGLAFRSLLIPLKSILLNTLTVATAYGVITLIFQDGWFAGLFGVPGGIGYVDASAPLFIFAIVFGLSMDYEVFLVARIYEAHQQGLSDWDAVVDALSATGGVITSAAAVMIVVFSSFIFSDVVLIKTLGIGLSVAILLDATLVRLALVPAMMFLAGRLNWWLPRPMARLADRVGLSHD
ncbi:MAG TPA: MMPL family transporter [Trueperaceae bacterium]